MMEFNDIMQDNEIRKAFGLRIREIRKKKKWTQKELASKIDVRFPQLNKYECGLHAPPLTKLIQLAEALDTTLDYLLTGDRTEEKPLHNIRLLERFIALEDFQAEDQETVIKLIDAMIIKSKVEGAINPFEKKAS
ncbi:MAG: helix-turn-helix transcriptional regulator [Desulfobacteraceae bacterium]|nr:helix-turn-helix transcriptional regulator [Desulfobacteraceae bacterium]MBC2758217.1 helix-turn-helix transcriptional regulator [Desulfobacteraceae bacterium]